MYLLTLTSSNYVQADTPPVMTVDAEDQAGAVLEADTTKLKISMVGGRSRLEVSFLVAPGTIEAGGAVKGRKCCERNRLHPFNTNDV